MSEDRIKEIKEATVLLKEELEKPDFKPAYETNGVKIAIRAVPNSSLNCNKGECKIAADINTIFDVMCDYDNRKTWDTMMMSAKVIEYYRNESNTDNIATFHMAYKSPSMFVSNRDFVTLSGTLTEEDGSVVMANRSVVDERCPEVKGFVRAHINIAGYIFKPANEEKTEWDVTYLTHLDIKGSVPTMVVNSVNKDQPAHLGLLRDVVEKKYKEKKAEK